MENRQYFFPFICNEAQGEPDGSKYKKVKSGGG